MSHQASDIITPKALLLDERLTPLEVFNLLMRQHAAKRHVPGAGEW